MTRTELITALEAATGPSRELDAQIEDHLHGLPEGWVSYPHAHQIRYTESIDAALSFTPEGWKLGLDPVFFEVEHDVKFDAILCRADWNKWNPVNSEWITRVEARAATPAIALCIANFKALEAQEEA